MQTLSSLIAGYLETDEYGKQLSPDTIKAYRIDLQQFLDFTGDEWADKDVLNQYIKHLNQHFLPVPLNANQPASALSTMRWSMRKVRGGHVTPHIFRYIPASNALNDGMDITVIQGLLGHTDPKTTLFYVELTLRMVKYEYERVVA